MIALGCSRCGRAMRQAVATPLGVVVQSHHASGRFPSEIDPEACNECGEDFLAECLAYHEARDAQDPMTDQETP